jgi:acyl-CoA thioesterase-1
MGTLLVLLIGLATPSGWLRAAGVASASAAEATQPPVILVFGDSLSAGYGIQVNRGWVSLLAQKLAQQGYGFQVVNASVSGETTAGGLARLPRALSLHHPAIVILELGANDGLRGLPLAPAQANLAQMIRLARTAGASVLLLGILMPPNYGERYNQAFRQMYQDLAQSFGAPLVPFLLDGVALHADLMQADGLHPNERGQPLLLANVWPKLAPLLPNAAGHSPALQVTPRAQPQ